MKSNNRILSLICFITVLLSACNQTRHALGLQRHQPDEFTAPPRNNLAHPSSLNLKPPQPHAPHYGVVATDVKAQEFLSINNSSNGSEKLSASEQSLLNTMIVHDVPLTIRNDIYKETNPSNHEKTLISKVLFWQKPNAKGDIIDPIAEKKNLDELPNATASEQRELLNE